MALTSCCGLLTLQVGAAILAAVFFALAGAILAANIFDYHSHGFWFPFSLILMIIFVVGFIVAAALMFASSYSESRSLALVAVVIIVILICYWLILCAFSFLSNPDHVMGVCIDTRCPETLWLGNLVYRRQHLTPADGKNESANLETTTYDVRKEWEKPDQYYKSELKGDQEYFEIKEHLVNFVSDQNIENNFEIGSSKYNRQRVYPIAMKKEKRWQDGVVLKYAVGDGKITQNPDKGTQQPPNCVTEKSNPSRYVFGFAMIGAIVLFIINLLFLLYSAFAMYSWAQELSWADYYYYTNDPVVLVDDY